MQQPRQYYINENQSCDEEDLDETNGVENSFNKQLFETITNVASHAFFEDKSGQVKVH